MKTAPARTGPWTRSARFLLQMFALWVVPMLVHAQAPTHETVKGVVTNEAGQPVAGAKVGTAFRLGSSFSTTQTIIRWEQPPVVTDAAGAFAIDAATIRYTKVLVAASENGTMGFVVRAADQPVVIRLAPPAVLKINLSKGFGSPTPVSFDLVSAGSAVGYGVMSPGTAQFIVPAGKVELRAHDVESHANATTLSLASSQTRRVALRLQPTAWAQNVGKLAPGFTPTDVQNLRAGTSLETLKDKWVLVEFWAKWCVPKRHAEAHRVLRTTRRPARSLRDHRHPQPRRRQSRGHP